MLVGGKGDKIGFGMVEVEEGEAGRGERRGSRVGTGDSFVGQAGQGTRPLARMVGEGRRSVDRRPQEAQHGSQDRHACRVDRGGRRRKTKTYHRARDCVFCKRMAPFSC